MLITSPDTIESDEQAQDAWCGGGGGHVTVEKYTKCDSIYTVSVHDMVAVGGHTGH